MPRTVNGTGQCEEALRRKREASRNNALLASFFFSSSRRVMILVDRLDFLFLIYISAGTGSGSQM